jgi:cytochrome P450
MADQLSDLSSLDFWRQGPEPRDPVFEEMRRSRPLSWHRTPDDIFNMEIDPDDGYWAVVRYDDVRRISRDPKTFVSGQGVMFGEAPQELLEATQSILAMDAPRHAKLRGLVSAAFTPRQVKRIEDGIRANARTVVEEAATVGGGDFVTLVAKRLPLMTISHMIGVPEADRERVVEAADVLVTVLDPEVTKGREPLMVMGEAVWTLSQFATELAAHREAHPGDDLMTALVQAEVDGERLSHAEIAAFFILLSVAGNDTTRHTTSQAMRALTLNPDERAYLIEDLEGRMPIAVEEFVRWATPVMDFRRTATRDVELHGETIRAGDKVVLFYTSANRDDTAFEDPYRFDVRRDPNHHVGFGGGGPHYCLGASLARTQLKSIFTELLTQIPDIEAGEPVYFDGAFINGVKSMPCSFTPRG